MDRKKAHKETIKHIGKLPCYDCKLKVQCIGVRKCNIVQNYFDIYNEVMANKALQTPKIKKLLLKLIGKKIPRTYFKPIDTVYDYVKYNGYDTN